MRFSVLALLLFTPVAALAQTTVQGRVVSPAGESIIAATVMLTGGGATKTASTDSAGHFVFYDVARGAYRLRAQSIGYLPLQRDITIGENPLVADFELTEAPVSIDAVTVEGQRQRARFQNQAGVTTRELSKGELKLIPGLAESDVLRAIEALPGVVSTSDFSSSYNVRGGSADQNLIMLDGIPIYNPFHLGGMFSIFNSDMVERAELLAGGFPAEYGGRVSSVLNVVSDIGHGGFNVEGGVSVLATRLAVAGELSASAAQKLGITSARFRVGGRRSYFDQLFKPVFDFPYHLTDLQLNAEVWKSQTSRFSLSGYAGTDVLRFAGVEDFPLLFNFTWGNNVVGAGWTKLLNNAGTVDVRTSFSHFDTFILFPEFGDTRFTSEIDHALIKGGVTLPVGKHQLKFGTELNRMWYDNLAQSGGTVFRRGNDVGWQPGMYAQMSLRPTPQWLIETGIREDLWHARTTSKTFSELAPRLAVKRFFADGDAAVKLALGRYTQFVHSLRDEEFPIGIDVWVLTGARAPVVVSDQIQTGIEWFPDVGWYAAVETYYRKFDNVTTNNFADNPNDDFDDLLRGYGVSYGGDAV
ncbi:MAG TPA: TonB-dependent receptor, partial [Longimicrobiales bacterium]|nr:TonB-dependent receptor [Longimicrobiales bacterium]